ncbi:unnamed protein product [Cuscuta europaea]|uniref:Uncharacterized protein n=1 Tax=Cuscuta europaea TaxID=41803 RepID=A0A9P1EDY8_CUSEU|nr:unnamed protein product [Cuscuta europaea]
MTRGGVRSTDRNVEPAGCHKNSDQSLQPSRIHSVVVVL